MEQKLLNSVNLISHRGNLEGPIKELENSPEYLNKAISLGYDVEVDIWYLNHKIHLGHDFPQYEVDEDYIKSISDKAWFHCKDFESIKFLSSNKHDYNYFWHESDKFTLTSKGFIWTFPGEQTSENSVIVDLSPDAKQNNAGCYAICSDYVL
jgi:hypothetical protein